MTFRCFLSAWIAAWAAAIFLPSMLIAYLGISPAATAIGTGFHRLPASSWKVADDVGPGVKLMIGGLLLICFFALDRWSVSRSGVRYAASAGIGLAAMAITIGLMPSALSRGFAAALTGTRFDPATTSIYLFGGAVAGLAFVFSSRRCNRDKPPRRNGSPGG